MNRPPQPPFDRSPTSERPLSNGPNVIDVQKMFAGKAEVRLIHSGAEYRLRITKQGKLILTK